MCKNVREEFQKLYENLFIDFYLWDNQIMYDVVVNKEFLYKFI